MPGESFLSFHEANFRLPSSHKRVFGLEGIVHCNRYGQGSRPEAHANQVGHLIVARALQ